MVHAVLRVSGYPGLFSRLRLSHQSGEDLVGAVHGVVRDRDVGANLGRAVGLEEAQIGGRV